MITSQRVKTYKMELKTGRDVSLIGLRHFRVTHGEEREPELVERSTRESGHGVGVKANCGQR